MLEGRDILFLSGIRWEFGRQRHQHLAALFARRNRVLFVEMALSPANLLKEPSLTRIHWKNWKKGLREIRPGLFRYTAPPVLPLGRSFFTINRFNQVLIRSGVKRTMKRLGFEKPLVWISDPYFSAFSGRKDGALTIFDWIHDDPGSPASRIARVYRRLLEETLAGADLIFTPTRAIAEREGENDPRYRYLPHGVDWNTFSRPPEEIPKELKVNPGPIIGFSGTVGPTLNFDLIGGLAEARPEWSFVFLGEIRRDPGVLRKTPNIVFLGPREYRELPRYLNGFQAGIIPYRIGPETSTVHPVKTYEYLAAGLPVVSTPLPELDHLGEMIETAAGTEEFIAALDRVLREDNPEKRQARREFARKNSWEKRMGSIEKTINAALESL